MIRLTRDVAHPSVGEGGILRVIAVGGRAVLTPVQMMIAKLHVVIREEEERETKRKWLKQ